MNQFDSIVKAKELINLTDTLLLSYIRPEEKTKLVNLILEELEPLAIIFEEINAAIGEEKIMIFRKHIQSYTIMKIKICKLEIELFDNLNE